MFLPVCFFASVLLNGASCQQDLVAFTAGQDTHLDLSNRVTIPFQKLITGHNTQLTHGVFTCQEPGLYKFQVYSLTKNNTSLYLDIYLNSRPVGTLWARSPHDYASAGNAVILRLNERDTVQVKSRDNAHVITFGTAGQIYTTFTGVHLGAYESVDSIPLAAFSAVLSHDQHVAGGATVKYDTVHVDDQHAYEGTTGTFTAPSGGIYVFHFFSLAKQNKELWQELYHNDIYVCSLYGKSPNEYADAGNSVVLRLQAGDQIQVRAHPSRPNELYGAANQMYTSFSGYELVSDVALDTNEVGPTVYFSAGLTQSMNFISGKNIVFDRVFIDHGTGNHYNHVTGEFTAPLSGTYEFNFHALGQKDSKVWLELYHNYKYIVSAYNHEPQGYAAAGNAAVIDLNDGDVILIRAHGTNALYGASDQVYCTFSGVLLHPSSFVSVVGK